MLWVLIAIYFLEAFLVYLISFCNFLKPVTPISDKDKILAPKNNPKYDPQSAIKVDKSANLISFLMIVFEVSGTTNKIKVLFSKSLEGYQISWDTLTHFLVIQLGFKQPTCSN